MSRVRIAAVAAASVVVLVALIALFSASGAAAQESVRIVDGATIALATPPFIVKGRRYAFSWPGGGPPQTFTVKEVRNDGWILVEVAEENIDPNIVPFGNLPVRWLNVALATSVQEMRPILH